MKDQILEETISHLNDLYSQITLILLSPQNYDKENIILDNVDQYLSFIDSVFHSPYNKLSHLHSFLTDTEGLLTNRMYPFHFLSKSSTDAIVELYVFGEKLVGGLNIVFSGDATFLEKEPYLVE